MTENKKKLRPDHDDEGYSRDYAGETAVLMPLAVASAIISLILLFNLDKILAFIQP